jgi:hypothetical protein
VKLYIGDTCYIFLGKWEEVGKVQGDTQCGVPGLSPGRKYKFRVKAVNKEGASDPLETDKDTVAKDPWGRYRCGDSYSIVRFG